MLCFLMHKITFPAQNNLKEEKMKEIYMLAGVGVGMLAGIMLYKYCDGAKKLVDGTEKKLMQKASQMEEGAEKKIQDVEKKVRKRLNKKEAK